MTTQALPAAGSDTGPVTAAAPEPELLVVHIVELLHPHESTEIVAVFTNLDDARVFRPRGYDHPPAYRYRAGVWSEYVEGMFAPRHRITTHRVVSR